MRISIFRKPSPVVYSDLFDETTFYRAFAQDIGLCVGELVIESPFIATRRIARLMPHFRMAIARGVKITINTRPLEEHEVHRLAAEQALANLQAQGVKVLYTPGHHRKLAILDRKILWEGSLNILSQHASCEIMRRTDSEKLAKQMLHFIRLKKFLD